MEAPRGGRGCADVSDTKDEAGAEPRQRVLPQVGEGPIPGTDLSPGRSQSPLSQSWREAKRVWERGQGPQDGESGEGNVGLGWSQLGAKGMARTWAQIRV